VDPRVTLLKEFYVGLPKDRAKVETWEHGFSFLENLLTDGVTLEYGELTPTGSLHKYKLSNIPDFRMNALLSAHIEKRCNVCLYFDDTANSTLCFNLDNNHKTNNTVLIPEMVFAVRCIREELAGLGCPPLIVASGRGYHVWCRLEAAAENVRLYAFMLRIAAKTMATLHEEGLDYRQIKFNLYPDCRIRDVVSLRLFGSTHAKNKLFSRILMQDGLLDEHESWAAFGHHLEHRSITLDTFNRAHAALAEQVGGDVSFGGQA
jgi:hypothetical protein